MVKLQHWLEGRFKTPVGDVPRVSTTPGFADLVGAVRVRLSIGRMDYSVEPGLYAVGNPGANSPVMISANYKLSFDALRRELGGLNVWMLVLDTKGVNVWCAAGKGTFGTDELVGRIRAANLEKVVTHRELILPQLGAPGIAAHLVRKESGFAVIYGPVRACDVKAFLKAGRKTLPGMRVVRFDLVDRLVVIPVELVEWFAWMLALSFAMLAMSGIVRGGYDYSMVHARGIWAVTVVIASYLAGGIVTPCLLPWLPGRAFSLKGIWVGLVSSMLIVTAGSSMFRGVTPGFEKAAFILIACAVTSFMAMNYTGTSTFTSQSGVKREMRIFVPVQIAMLVVGVCLWVVAGCLR